MGIDTTHRWTILEGDDEESTVEGIVTSLQRECVRNIYERDGERDAAFYLGGLTGLAMTGFPYTERRIDAALAEYYTKTERAMAKLWSGHTLERLSPAERKGLDMFRNGYRTYLERASERVKTLPRQSSFTEI